MLSYILKRICLMFVTLFGITIIVFLVINSSPIDPAQMALRGSAGADGGVNQSSDENKQGALQEMREHYNLDKPVIYNNDVLDQPKILKRCLKDLSDLEKIEEIPKDDKLREEQGKKLATAKKYVVGLGSITYKNIYNHLKKNSALPHLTVALARCFYPSDLWENTVFEKLKDPLLSNFMVLAENIDRKLKRKFSKKRKKRLREKATKANQFFMKWWEKNRQRFDAKEIKKQVQYFTSSDSKKQDSSALELIFLGKIAIPSLISYLMQNTNENLRIRTMDVMSSITRERYLYQAKDTKEVKAGIMREWKRWWERNDKYFVTLTSKQKIFRSFVYTRYGTWMSRLMRFDFGKSISHDKPVMSVIWGRIHISIALAVTSVFFVYLLSIPLGIYSATHRDMTSDRVLTLLLFILYSLPSFWVALLLIQWFTSGSWNFFPAYGLFSNNYDQLSWFGKCADVIHHLMLPVFCLTYGGLAYISRQMRAGMLESIKQDYIRTARAKGLSENKVIFKHCLRNSLIPILTLMAGLLPALIGGSVIIEVIFSIEGMGKASFDAIMQNDMPLIMGFMFLFAVLTLVGILIVDILYAVVDPRISYD